MEMQSPNKRNILFVILGVFCLVFATYFATTQYYNSQFHVYYSLDQKHNDKEIISVIDGAESYVYFAIYYFSKDNIADALIRAKKRGLIVWGIVDRVSSTSANKSIVDTLRNAGIAVETQKHPDGIMHIKAVVTDKAYASGSYNWTGSATTVNDEVLEVGTNKSVHDKYFLILKKLLLTNQ